MYTEVLIQIKNAGVAKREIIKVPYSTMDMAILELLKRHNYIRDTQKKGRLPKRIIEITLLLGLEAGGMSGVRFLSKPSRHIYANYRDLKNKRDKHKLTVLSTPKGIMTAAEAVRTRVGGELLFEVW